jgi:predicted nucleotide-binding protein
MADARPVLVIPRADAIDRLQAQIRKGRELAEAPVAEEPNGSRRIRQADVDKWHAYNAELLSRLFNNDEIREEYEGANVEAVRRSGRYGKVPEFNVLAARVSRHVRNYVTALEAILERLDLIPDSTESLETEAASIPGPTDKTRVFIVHGHDEAMKEAVARFVSQHLKLTPVILHEQPNRGRTIIDKFESTASAVGFAIVLFSADDVCGAFGDDGSGLRKPRPRQNVVFELGFFVGKLGRQSVAVLYREGVEMPSDYQGVLYIPFDTAGAWRLIVAREMVSAGLPIDLNGLLTSG